MREMRGEGGGGGGGGERGSRPSRTIFLIMHMRDIKASKTGIF